MSELYTAGYTKNPDYNSLIKLWKRMGHSVPRETLEDLRIAAVDKSPACRTGDSVPRRDHPLVLIQPSF